MRVNSPGPRATRVAVCLWLAVAASMSLAAASRQSGTAAAAGAGARDTAATRATPDRYCVTCHNQRVRSGELQLDTLELTKVGANAATWEKVLRKVRTGAMPPAGLPRPDASTAAGLVSDLTSALDRAAVPNPGRPLLHRLNRAEYANVIRDLLAIDVDVRSLLPADDSAFGFDNNADLLVVSPSLLDRYLSAADRVSALAVGDMTTGPGSDTFYTKGDQSQSQQLEGLP